MKKRLLLPLVIVLVGCMDAGSMVTPSEESDPLYPIHIQWHECNYEPHPAECGNVSWPISPSELDPVFVAAVQEAVDEWARVLAPTPTEPYVVPALPDGGSQGWNCHGMEIVQSGDVLAAGFTLHVLILIEDGSFAATGSTCGHSVWGGDPNPKPPSGVIAFGKKSIEVVSEGSRAREYFRKTALHELGHVFMSSNRWYAHRKWNEDRSVVWLEDPEAVAVFNRMGGANYPGRKVPVTFTQHWACAVPNDIMEEGIASRDVPGMITDLTLSVLWRGFESVPQGGNVSVRDWSKCPELADGMSREP